VFLACVVLCCDFWFCVVCAVCSFYAVLFCFVSCVIDCCVTFCSFVVCLVYWCVWVVCLPLCALCVVCVVCSECHLGPWLFVVNVVPFLCGMLWWGVVVCG